METGVLKHRVNQLPEFRSSKLKIHKRINPLYRVLDFYIDLMNFPLQDRCFGMIATVINDPVKTLNKTYQFIDKDRSSNLSDNNNWIIYSNKINEVLGLNGQHFENKMEITIVHGMGIWPINYLLVNTEGLEIHGRVKFLNDNAFKVSFDKYPVSGYLFFYY